MVDMKKKCESGQETGEKMELPDFLNITLPGGKKGTAGRKNG